MTLEEAKARAEVLYGEILANEEENSIMEAELDTLNAFIDKEEKRC